MPHNDHAPALAAASGIATLDGSSKVVQDPANAQTGGASAKIPIADGAGKIADSWGGNASTLATLNGSSLVVQNPADASTTPGSGVIPIADGSGQLAAGFGGAANTLATLDVSSEVVEDPASKLIPRWVKITVAEAAFTANATTEDIEVYSLLAGGVIHGVKLKHSTAFSGGSLASFTVSIGIGGDLTKYASAFDIFQAVADTTFQLTNTLGSEDHGSPTSIRIAAVSGGDDVIAATAGSVDVWILVSELV